MRGLAAVAIGLALVGCGAGGDSGSGSRTDEILATASDASSGAGLYDSNCAGCHGSSGEGGAGAALAGSAGKVSALSDAQIVDAILSGATGMPAYSNLSDNNIADILAYLRSAFGG